MLELEFVEKRWNHGILRGFEHGLGVEMAEKGNLSSLRF